MLHGVPHVLCIGVGGSDLGVRGWPSAEIHASSCAYGHAFTEYEFVHHSDSLHRRMHTAKAGSHCQ